MVSQQTIREDRIRFHIEKLEKVYVMEETPKPSARLPSVLGNDLLKRFDLSTDRQRGQGKLKRIPTAEGEPRIVSRLLPKQSRQPLLP